MRNDEMCPKCHSSDVDVWSFNRRQVSYQCNNCRHKWVGPRKSLREIIDVAVEKNVRAFLERLRRTGIISESVTVNDEEAFRKQLGDMV